MAETKKTDTPVIVRKRKASTASSSKEDDSNTKPANKDTTDTDHTIRILFHGSCAKLSPRGKGDLEYEIGINDSTNESCIRIVGNASSGAFSKNWINLNDIQSIFEKIEEETFRAVVLRDLYANTSSNNAGFLASALREEGVIKSLPEQPTSIQLGEWKAIADKIDLLKKTGVDLPDHIAIAANKRAEKKRKKKSAA
jgi:hypothetical protein